MRRHGILSITGRLFLISLLGAALLGSSGTAQETTERLLVDPCREMGAWRVYLGSEFPGASGKAETIADAIRGHCIWASFGFALEGRYAGVQWTGEIVQGDTIGFWVKLADRERGLIRIRDAGGQEHLGGFSARRGEWANVEIALLPENFRSHWGGANDGAFHYPLTAILIGVNRGPDKAEMFLSSLYTVVQKAEASDAWRVSISPSLAAGVAFCGEKAEYAVTVFNRLQKKQTYHLRVTAQPLGKRPQTIAEREGIAEGWSESRLLLSLPTDRLGYYGLRADLTAASGNAMPPAYSALAVVLRPRHYGESDPACYFGLQLCPDVAVAERLGAKAIRLFPGWRWVEPRQGLIRWEEYLDASVLPALEHQMQVLLTLQGIAPGWAAWKVKDRPKLESLPDPAHLDAWREFCRKVAERYRGKLAAIEIQNEPDLTCCRQPELSFDEGVDYYAKLLKAGYEGVKAGDPNVPVAGLDVSGGDFDKGFPYTDAVLSMASKYLDLYTGHPYASPRQFGPYKRPKWPMDNRMAENCRIVLDILARHGLPRRMWVGELGWCLDARAEPLSEYSLDFAACVAQALIVGKSVQGVERFLYFTLAGCNESGYEYGLLRGAPLYPLPAACAYAACAYALDHAAPVEMVSISGDVCRASFSAPERDELIVAWFILRSSRTTATENGWAKSEAASLLLPKDAPQGRWLDSFCRTVTPGQGVRVGRLPMYWILPLSKVGPRPDFLSQVHAEAAERVRVENLVLSARDVLTLVVTNRTKKRQTLTVVVDGRRQRIEVPAGAKAQRSDVPLAKPLRVNQPEKLSVRIGGGGIAAQQTINVNLAPLYGPPADFKCDGDLAEWGSRKAIVLSERGQILPPDPGVGWDGPEDLSAKVYLAADTKALYFAAAVTDDVHTASACRPDNFWNSDSIQIALDPRNDSGDAFDEDDRELGLVLGADGPRAFITHPRPWRRLEVPVRIKREGNQTICEAVFPWDALGTPPLRPGQIIALNFIINDNDGHGRAYWMGLTPGIGEAKVPASYQKFCYEGGKE